MVWERLHGDARGLTASSPSQAGALAGARSAGMQTNVHIDTKALRRSPEPGGVGGGGGGGGGDFYSRSRTLKVAHSSQRSGPL